MSLPAHQNPAQLPTLTEVIELLSPSPVGDGGMHSAPRSAAPAPGSPGSAPIVTGGLASSQAPSNWTPMTTVVVPTLHEVAMPMASAPAMPAFDLPVLESVVPELDLVVAPVASFALNVAPAVVVAAAAPEPISEPAPQVQLPVQLQEQVPAQAPALPDITEAQLAQRVLSVVQKQIDGMIDFRLKEAMAPILARHSEALVRDLREELSRTMADVVARSVAQEMAKLRHR